MGDRHLFYIGIQPIKLTSFFRVCDLKKQENNNFSKIFDAKTFIIFYETTTNTTKKKKKNYTEFQNFTYSKGKEKSS